ncbi:hypothetical protein F4778DRAFT_56041 [Xylariomycetidae sp. FL2044]|nr:hypothetical protein F4778DRAFT_56041 [Xylariomycetidae sp. FL2044]
MEPGGSPTYGRRLMTAVLDELAKSTPTRLYAAIPKSADVTEGFRDITVADMARCVDFMAHWIENLYGRSQDFETISFIGIPDLRGAAIFQAVVKCGFKLLLPSPRNPPSTNKSLMEQTGSTKLLYAAECRPIVKQLEDVVPYIQFTAVPSFDEMITSTPKHYPYEKTFDSCRNDPVVVLHSSGSTGLPKPITMTHGSFAVLDNEHNLPDVPGRRKRDWSMWTFDGEARVYTVFPFFHLAGFLSLTLQTIFMNASPVLGPPHLLPEPALLKQVILNQKLRSMFLPPAVIEGLLHEPNGIDYFKGLDFMVYSGAPFSPVNGDLLSKVVEIISPFGSTEVYPQPKLAPSTEDWAYHEFNPFVKHNMELYDANEGTYELVILVDESTKDTAAAYHNLPGISEYHTKDLFVQHPEKPQLYRYYGRRDDIIVLANGEKFNPIPLEVSVQGHPALKGAFVIGSGRRTAALLVEPKELLDGSGRHKLLDDLWPLISKSNHLIPGQGRIQRSKVLCGTPEKPFMRTGKGTIVRRLTEAAYENEIEQLYDDKSAQADLLGLQLRPTLNYELNDIMKFCHSVIATSLPIAATIGDDDDFITYGLDSEQTLEIISNLKHTLKSQTDKSVDWISPWTIFRNSTIQILSGVFQEFLNTGAVPGEDLQRTQIRLAEDAVSYYTRNLPDKVERANRSSLEPRTVAVVGSTGYLGSYIVAALIKDPSIAKVFCLNRVEDARAKQASSLRELGLDNEETLDKLVFMTVNLEHKLLGLSPKDTERIANEVDVLILNAWKSNFVLPLRSFNPFLHATREVLELAASGARGIHILFVSSLGSVQTMTRKAKAPEAVVHDPLAATTGYGQSKLAAERILAIGSQKCGVPVSVFRLGQIGGPTDTYSGKWAEQGWISAIAKTAKTINLIPTGGPAVDWVPVDMAAKLLQHVAVLRPPEYAQFFNVLHPKPERWSLFVEALQETLGVKQTAPMEDWIRTVRERGESRRESQEELPALTLLDYYKEMFGHQEFAGYEVSLAAEVVEAPLDRETLMTWLRGWGL